jgi:Tol biopolymer transport system component
MLAFDSRQGSQSVIYVAPVDRKAELRRIAAPAASNNMLPSWSRDGKFLYYASNRSGKWQIWKQPVSEDGAEQVTKQGGFGAFEAADGTLYYSKSPSTPGIYKMPGEEMVLSSASAPKWGWTLSGSGIYFIETSANEEGPAELRYFDFRTKASRAIGRTSAKPALGGTSVSVSPDERWIAYAQLDREGSDIILVQGFR